MIERRDFLTALVAGTTGALLPAAAWATNAPAPVDKKDLPEVLRSIVGDEFRALDADGAVSYIKLAAFDDGPDCAGLTQFSVVLEGVDLQDGLYELSHPKTGELLISCQPSTADATPAGRQRAHFSYFS